MPPPPATGREFRRFVLRFLGSLLLFSMLFTVTNIQNHLSPLENAIAAGTALGARAVGVGVTRTGNSLAVTGGFHIEINHECTAFFVLMIYGAFLLAYPATPWERLRGFLIGIVVLMAVNVARLIGLVIVVDWRPSMFDYFHEYFFQVMFLGLITVLAHRWLATLKVQRDVLVLPG